MGCLFSQLPETFAADVLQDGPSFEGPQVSVDRGVGPAELLLDCGELALAIWLLAIPCGLRPVKGAGEKVFVREVSQDVASHAAFDISGGEAVLVAAFHAVFDARRAGVVAIRATVAVGSYADERTSTARSAQHSRQ